MFAEAEQRSKREHIDRVRGDYEYASLDAGRTNHDEVHRVTAVNRFLGNGTRQRFTTALQVGVLQHQNNCKLQNVSWALLIAIVPKSLKELQSTKINTRTVIMTVIV